MPQQLAIEKVIITSDKRVKCWSTCHDGFISEHGGLDRREGPREGC